jgi:alpha-beta hydrolase superfamily lysophospholipase
MRRSSDSIDRLKVIVTSSMNTEKATNCAGSVVKMNCEDGYPLSYRKWAACGKAVAALFLLNGMMSHSGWFADLAFILSQSRIKVVGADRRGSGLNALDRGNAPSRKVLLSDFRQLVEQEDSGVPMYLVGWCWGAVLAVNAALGFGSKFRGMILLAPGLFPSEQINRAVQDEVRRMQDTSNASGLLRSPITDDMFTPVRELQEFIAHDQLALRAITPQFLRVSQQMQLVATTRLAHLINPVLLLLAANDQAVDNERTLTAFQRLPAGALTWATLACNHGMQFEAPQEIAWHITKWMNLHRVSERETIL